MFQPKEIEKIEKNILKTLSSIENEYFNIMMGDNYGGFEEDYPGWTQDWIKIRLNDLYVLIQSYFEIRQVPLLLHEFKNELSKQFEKNIFESELTNPEGEPELKIILLFRRYLEPFSFFDYSKIKEDENLKLSSILQNTGFILKNVNKNIKNESDIYKQVKWVLGLYYPSCRLRNKASFIQEFKTYIPDILIPELSTAIEYKYLDSTNDNLDEFLDQIKIDATNYVNDYRYDTFYAVIYIEDISIATPESIEIAWKSKHFPNNWNLILCGHSVKNKK